MNSVLSIAAVAACLAVLVILAIGIGGFGSGKASPSFSNKMMRYRIVAQTVAVVLLLAVVLFTQAE
ncbi:MAG: twin transmembrane helix small protein [Pseudomonadota bacterium]